VSRASFSSSRSKGGRFLPPRRAAGLHCRHSGKTGRKYRQHDHQQYWDYPGKHFYSPLKLKFVPDGSRHLELFGGLAINSRWGCSRRLVRQAGFTATPGVRSACCCGRLCVKADALRSVDLRNRSQYLQDQCVRVLSFIKTILLRVGDVKYGPGTGTTRINTSGIDGGLLGFDGVPLARSGTRRASSNDTFLNIASCRADPDPSAGLSIAMFQI